MRWLAEYDETGALVRTIDVDEGGKLVTPATIPAGHTLYWAFNVPSGHPEREEPPTRRLEIVIEIDIDQVQALAESISQSQGFYDWGAGDGAEGLRAATKMLEAGA